MLIPSSIIEARTGADACVGWYRGSHWTPVWCSRCQRHTWSEDSSSDARPI